MKAIHGCIDGLMPWPLFFHGSPGTGKTCAALCLLDMARGEYFTCEELTETHNACKFGRYEERMPSGGVWKPDSIRWREIKLNRPPLVVLDELGLRGQASASMYEVVKHVLDLREGRPLIVISNLGWDDVERSFDARVTSRLAAGTMHEMVGPDRRLL